MREFTYDTVDNLAKYDELVQDYQDGYIGESEAYDLGIVDEFGRIDGSGSREGHAEDQPVNSLD
jgi:hypothetical protein